MQLEWVNVKDRLPEIPEGRYGVSVLVAELDRTLEDIRPGCGYNVHSVIYAYTRDRDGVKNDWFTDNDIDIAFMQSCTGQHGSSWEWCPMFDEVTHWMYMPEPPMQFV